MRILIVDDDAILRMTLRALLEPSGHVIVEAVDGEQAIALVEQNPGFGAAIIDVNMPRLSGIEVLGRIKDINPAICCLIATAFSDIKDAVAAVKLGAFDYIQKPIESICLKQLLEAAQESSSLVEAAAFSAPQLLFDDNRAMIGESRSLLKIFHMIHKLAKVDTSVLIRGESGTGKELVARALHFNSVRRKNSFVAVNCAAIPDHLLESELFGFERGAFTGADKKKLGKFQLADGGTIFLDEIGDMSVHMQVKLLRVLQERILSPVGSTVDSPIDVRVIAATNRPLEKMIERETFREDLFYRLNILPICLPALRERVEDIDALIKHLIKKLNNIHQRTVAGVDPLALKAMKKHLWPGNIRELENVIERSFILESSDTIRLASLPEHIQTVIGQERIISGAVAEENLQSLINKTAGASLNFPALKEKFEKDFIIKALTAFKGKINQTAEHTEMTKVTLLRKLEKYGINASEYH